MATVSLHILVWIACLLHLGHEFNVCLVQKIGIAASNPEEGRFPSEIFSQLGIRILLERSHLLLVYSHRS